MNSQYPRLLIINGTAIGDGSGTGVTLGNLFSNWPTKNILQLCFSNGNSFDASGSTYIPFPPQTAYIDNIVRKVFAGTNLSHRFNQGVQGMNAGIALPTLKSALHDCVRALLDDSPIQMPGPIMKLVDEYQPNVIYSNLAGLRILKSVLFFAKHYKIKIVAHFMDDWPSTIYTTSVLSQWANKTVDRQIRHCLSHSECSLGISEYMAEEYAKRFGVQFTWACNPIEVPGQVCLLTDEHQLTFTYIGGLHLNRWKSLEIIAEALEGFNQQGYQTFLDIYTKEEDRLAFQPQMKALSVINWKGHVSAERVPAILQASNVLVHAESFDANIIDFTRYSFSTKLSEYLASGRPIVAYAPRDIASTRYIEKYGGGLVADTPQTLYEQLQRLLMDAKLRRQLGSRGLELARIHHQKDVVQQRVLDAIQSNLGQASLVK